ncbi:MAG TPA: hypothetical protein VK968_09085 [Roseimicrobium sp.]|nr:hypothetical protein [Roseimicrobium sp.]
MRFITPAPLAYIFITLVASLSVSARVGETQDEFERRILQPSVGKFVPKDKNADPSREEEIQQQQPFNQFKVNFPEGTRERKYWKSAVPNMLSNENGWKIHVFFLSGRSVMEAYQRVGDSLNEFEIQIILRANQGVSEWHKVESDSAEAQASVIGCDYQLADGTMKARIVGDWLMVYSAKLDAHLKEQIKLSEAARASQHEEKVRQQQLNAPATTSGF